MKIRLISQIIMAKKVHLERIFDALGVNKAIFDKLTDLFQRVLVVCNVVICSHFQDL